MTLPSGHLALLDKTRRENEKLFPENRTKVQEKKSWATTTTTKQMQSPFVAHNFPIRWKNVRPQPDAESIVEIQRERKRLEQRETQDQAPRVRNSSVENPFSLHSPGPTPRFDCSPLIRERGKEYKLLNIRCLLDCDYE